MRLELSADSRVLVDLKASGLLGAVGHDPTLAARADAIALEVGEGALDVAVEARFPVAAIEPPPGMSPSDREKLLDNLRGPDVLDAARFPAVALRARFVGTTEGGRLEGQLVVRGQPRPVAFDVRVSRRGDTLEARGSWEGTLTDLGIKPFRALLGALKLKDWIRLRLELTFRPGAGA